MSDWDKLSKKNKIGAKQTLFRVLENIVENKLVVKKREKQKTLSIRNYVINKYPGYSVSVSRTSSPLGITI